MIAVYVRPLSHIWVIIRIYIAAALIVLSSLGLLFSISNGPGACDILLLASAVAMGVWFLRETFRETYNIKYR